MLGAKVNSQVQTISALRWLLNFRIFDLAPVRGAISYRSMAKKSKVPPSELARMLRMVMANHIFLEYGGESVQHNHFSSLLSKDDAFIYGLPFLCDTVMPASQKMVKTTVRWKGSQKENKTARNLAFDNDLNFARFLT